MLNQNSFFVWLANFIMLCFCLYISILKITLRKNKVNFDIIFILKLMTLLAETLRPGLSSPFVSSLVEVMNNYLVSSIFNWNEQKLTALSISTYNQRSFTANSNSIFLKIFIYLFLYLVIDMYNILLFVIKKM